MLLRLFLLLLTTTTETLIRVTYIWATKCGQIFISWYHLLWRCIVKFFYVATHNTHSRHICNWVQSNQENWLTRLFLYFLLKKIFVFDQCWWTFSGACQRGTLDKHQKFCKKVEKYFVSLVYSTYLLHWFLDGRKNLISDTQSNHI